MSIKFEQKLNLKKYNAYCIDSVCSKAWFPKNELELLTIYDKNPDKKKIIIGNGNNIILSKKYYEEEFIILNDCFNVIQIIENGMTAEAGATLQQLSGTALLNSLSGLEIFYDIPSSVGGAIVMNAGTKDGEIKDIVIKVRYLDLADMRVKEIAKEKIEFGYRNSFFQKHSNNIILKAWFNLRKGNQVDILKKMEQCKEKRWFKQPREFPNCGSVFKRPAGRFVGPMLDELGLKGFTIGGAQISKKHSGFIINIGEATGKDILEVITEVQRRVKERFEIDLEVEQRII
jgi:UDP-N-acetylmuramate dehydrogenase